jgi:hypothetical protein
MVRRVTTQTVDDLDGGVADETVTFGYDGITYEVDLSKANAIKLRSSLQPYVAAARRTGGHPLRTHTVQQHRKRSASRTRRDPEQTKAIRSWANANGYAVSPRGKISDAVSEAYEAAH